MAVTRLESMPPLRNKPSGTSLRSRSVTEVVSRSSSRSTASANRPAKGFTTCSSAQYRRERDPEELTRSIVPAGSLLMPSQIDWGAGTYPRVRNASNAARLTRSEEHTSELQSHSDLVCRLLLEKKKHATARSRAAGRRPSPPTSLTRAALACGETKRRR